MVDVFLGLGYVRVRISVNVEHSIKMKLKLAGVISYEISKYIRPRDSVKK